MTLILLGLFEEGAERISTASHVVEVKGEDLANPCGLREDRASVGGA